MRGSASSSAVVLFFVGCIQLFFLGSRAGVPHLGFVFFVWVGIFSLTMIAQFWSYANEIYSRPEGDRLFPLIAIGSTAGAPLGAAVAERLFAAGTNPFLMMELAAAILLVHLGLYRLVAARMATSARPAGAGPHQGRQRVRPRPEEPVPAHGRALSRADEPRQHGRRVHPGAGRGRSTPTRSSPSHASFDKAAYIGSFYGSYFFWTNVSAIVLQAFVVSRIVKKLGLAGAVLALPIVALGAYSLAAAGAALALLLSVKIAENSTDYSVMNTAKQMIWLPTTREEKYKAKQAIDTFFVRAGDMLAAGLVFLGTHVFQRGVAGFARSNVLIVLLAIGVAVFMLREYRRLTAPSPVGGAG